MKRFRNILFFADRQDGLTAALDRAVAVSQTNEARLTAEAHAVGRVVW